MRKIKTVWDVPSSLQGLERWHTQLPGAADGGDDAPSHCGFSIFGELQPSDEDPESYIKPRCT